MGLTRLIAGLPMLPLQVPLALARIVSDEANRGLHDPAAVRRLLEDVAEAREAGLLSADEAARMEHEAFRHLIWQEDT